jgi:serine/threonine protein kinase/regulator of sirC expression with transglutaminase-like and TPR domain
MAESAYHWRKKGDALKRQGQLEEAIRCYDAGLLMNSSDPYLWYGKGNALYKMKNYTAAIECQDRALALNPRLDRPWYDKGNIFRDMGDYTEAIRCYDRAIETAPKPAYPWYGKGTTYHRMGNYAEALLCYDRAIALDSHLGKPWLMKGDIYADTGAPAQAMECYQKAIATEPRLYEAEGRIRELKTKLQETSFPSVNARPDSSQDTPPPLTSRYEQMHLIGKGGFASVYQARRRSNGKIVAVKIPRIDEKNSSLFIKEIAAWYNLRHPNIVTLYNADIFPVPLIEMEYVGGYGEGDIHVENLDQVPKPVPVVLAFDLVRGIAGGLIHAHGKGIYHLDLKPQNILLDNEGNPKITDFGLAGIGARSSLSIQMGFSPLYAAPEQIDQATFGKPDARTDVYLLGMILYELLTGEMPYEGSSPTALFGMILSGNTRMLLPSVHDPSLRPYDGIFEKLIARRKEDRFQSVEEFLDALDALSEFESRALDDVVEGIKESLSVSSSHDESRRLRQGLVSVTAELAIIHARSNNRADLLCALTDLRYFTEAYGKHLDQACQEIEYMIAEGISIQSNRIEALKVLCRNIERENRMA